MQLLMIRAAGFTATVDACATRRGPSVPVAIRLHRDGRRLRSRRGTALVPVPVGKPAGRARPLGPAGQGRDRLPRRGRADRRLALLAGPRGLGHVAIPRLPPALRLRLPRHAGAGSRRLRLRPPGVPAPGSRRGRSARAPLPLPESTARPAAAPVLGRLAVGARPER